MKLLLLLLLQSCTMLYSPVTGKKVAAIPGDIKKFRAHVTKDVADISFDSSSVSSQIQSSGVAGSSLLSTYLLKP